jgi:hypothetical protein
MLPAISKGVKPTKPRASWEQIPLGVVYGGGMLTEDLASFAAKATDPKAIKRPGKRLKLGSAWSDVFSNVGKVLNADAEEVQNSQADAQDFIRGAASGPLSKTHAQAKKVQADAQKTLEELYPELNRAGKSLAWTTSGLPDYVMSGGKSKMLQAANTGQQMLRSFGNTPPDTLISALTSIGIPGNSLAGNAAGNIIQNVPVNQDSQTALDLIDLLLNSIDYK